MDKWQATSQPRARARRSRAPAGAALQTGAGRSAAVQSAAPPPGLVAAAFSDYGPGVRGRRPFGRQDYLLTLTTDGAGLFRMGDASWESRPGDVVLIEPGVPHDYGTAPAAPRWALFWVHFAPPPWWQEWLDWSSLAPGLRRVRLVGAALQRVSEAFRRMLSDLESTGRVREPGGLQHRLALNAVEEILLVASREAARRSPARRADPRVQEALDLLQRDLAAPHTLGSVAAHVALSPSRLRHLFRAQVGRGFAQALTWLRLMQAARLLERTDLDLARVAEAVGFGGPRALARRFRAEFGISPRGYRATVRAAPRAEATGGGAGPSEP